MRWLQNQKACFDKFLQSKSEKFFPRHFSITQAPYIRIFFCLTGVEIHCNCMSDMQCRCGGYTLDIYIGPVLSRILDRSSGETPSAAADVPKCNVSMNFPVAILYDWKGASSLFTASYVGNKEHSFVTKVNLFKSHHNMSLLTYSTRLTKSQQKNQCFEILQLSKELNRDVVLAI